MNPIARVVAATTVMVLCGSVSAQSAGSFSARVGVTRIDPQTSSGWLSPPAFANTRVDVGAANQISGGLTYMVTDNWALDMPVAPPFKHNFYGAGAIAGVGKIGETKALPISIFAQYRFGEANSKFRPYVALGLTYAVFTKERTTAALNGLTGGTLAHPTTASVDNKFGVTPQIGFVYNFNERWFVDASFSKSFLKTKAHLSSGQSINLKLDPNVYFVGVGYRF